MPIVCGSLVWERVDDADIAWPIILPDASEPVEPPVTPPMRPKAEPVVRTPPPLPRASVASKEAVQKLVAAGRWYRSALITPPTPPPRRKRKADIAWPIILPDASEPVDPHIGFTPDWS